MRAGARFAVASVMILPVMLFTASCGKKAVQTQSVSMAGPEVRKAPDTPVSMTEPEVQKAPDRPAGKTEPDGRLEENRLRAEAAARVSAITAIVGENVHFSFDSSLLSDQARQILTGKAEYLRTNPDITVTVGGHCDERGTNAYNTALGERRAESVKVFLVDLGIGANRLNTASYGEERPIAMGHDEASWAKNRSARFAIN